MNNPLIHVQNLVYDYPGFRALNGISLTIESGTVTALVGPNGAGKTTLLRCIAALESPLSGSVHVQGLDVHDSPREAHKIMGFLSDNFGLYRELTVAQGLEYAARSQGLPASQVPAAVLATAQQMDLLEKLPQTAATLSRGQRQRLAIGQAIIHSPQVLLLDEPASGLDPQARSSLAQVFLALQARGMSLLVSSHILAELDEYCTHMLALDGGRVLDHRELHLSNAMDVSGDVPRERLLHLAFASPVEAFLPWLVEQPGVRVQETKRRAVDIAFTGTEGDQASLIAACVAAGYPLMVVAPVNENLQQSYLKSLQAGRTAGQRGELSRPTP